MLTTDIAADMMNQSLGITQSLMSDLSDADLMMRPAPKANHAKWQLGHLISAETMFGNMAKPGSMPELPAGFDARFNKETAGSDDPNAFPSKEELLALFKKTRESSIKWVKSCSEQDLKQPMPEKMRSFVPTVGHVVFLIPNHDMMHVGQVTVLRRKLGKPVLF
jgi:uncharacterized damage-inducible protein DinB